jgi:hypothetical protein
MGVYLFVIEGFSAAFGFVTNIPTAEIGDLWRLCVENQSRSTSAEAEREVI